MSTSGATKQRSSSTRHSKITVEYYRPTRKSIQGYGTTTHQVNPPSNVAWPPLTVSNSRPLPPPPGPSSTSFKQRDPLPTTIPPTHKVHTPPHKLQPPRRTRIQTDTIQENHATDSSAANNTDPSPIRSSYSDSDDSSPNVVSPPRPSPANASNINHVSPNPSVVAQGMISAPVIGPTEFPSAGTTRARSATISKGKKGMLGFVSDLLGSNKRVEISTPYDPVHPTHVGFNNSTGEFTGLPKEWKQLLQDNGISPAEQENIPEAVMEIVNFYRESGGDVWNKTDSAVNDGPPALPAPPLSNQENGTSTIKQEEIPEAVMEIVRFYREGGGEDPWDKMGWGVRLFNLAIPASNTNLQQRQARVVPVPNQPRQPTLVARSNSTTNQPVAASRNVPIPPSNLPDLHRSVSARTQPKPESPAMYRLNATKEARNTPNRHRPYRQRSQTQLSVNHHHQQIFPTSMKPKASAIAQPSPDDSSVNPKTYHKPEKFSNHLPFAEAVEFVHGAPLITDDRPLPPIPDQMSPLQAYSSPPTEEDREEIEHERDLEKRPESPASIRTLSTLSFHLEDHNVDQPSPHLTSARPDDTATTSVTEGACGRLIKRAFTPQELPSLIDEALSNEDGAETIRCLTIDDAQTLIDVIDEILVTHHLVHWVQKKCLRLLYRTCGHHARLPSALAVPASYDRTGDALFRGGYADVWKEEYCSQDVAVKVIRTYSTNELQKIINLFCKEVVTWKFLQHSNILPLIGVLTSENRFAMVSKWMVNGNINQFVKAHPEANRFELLAGVSKGLIYLHSNGMVHGDLKGANILIDETCNARLADFGLLTIISDPTNLLPSSSHTQAGTARWMSPELLDPEQFGFEKSRRTESSDCYALGMVIYETISGKLPFYEDADLTVLVKVIGGKRPTRGECFPKRLWKMLERCWSPQQSNRPSVGDVLQSLRRSQI